MSQEPMNNFTPRAQQVLALARKEADRFHHNYVGTEHILLGLIKLGQGVAVSVLQKMGLDLETVRAAVEKQVGTGQETRAQNSIPYTPRVKKVLALAGRRRRRSTIPTSARSTSSSASCVRARAWPRACSSRSTSTSSAPATKSSASSIRSSAVRRAARAGKRPLPAVRSVARSPRTRRRSR